MQTLLNPFRNSNGFGITDSDFLPSVDVNQPKSLLSRCPVANVTPLMALNGFGAAGEVYVKDERFRMGVGSFKPIILIDPYFLVFH